MVGVPEISSLTPVVQGRWYTTIWCPKRRSWMGNLRLFDVPMGTVFYIPWLKCCGSSVCPPNGCSARDGCYRTRGNYSRVSAKFREQLNALWLGPDRKRRQKERVCRSSSGQKCDCIQFCLQKIHVFSRKCGIWEMSSTDQCSLEEERGHY